MKIIWQNLSSEQFTYNFQLEIEKYNDLSKSDIFNMNDLKIASNSMYLLISLLEKFEFIKTCELSISLDRFTNSNSILNILSILNKNSKVKQVKLCQKLNIINLKQHQSSSVFINELAKLTNLEFIQPWLISCVDLEINQNRDYKPQKNQTSKEIFKIKIPSNYKIGSFCFQYLSFEAYPRTIPYILNFCKDPYLNLDKLTFQLRILFPEDLDIFMQILDSLIQNPVNNVNELALKQSLNRVRKGFAQQYFQYAKISSLLYKTLKLSNLKKLIIEFKFLVVDQSSKYFLEYLQQNDQIQEMNVKFASSEFTFNKNQKYFKIHFMYDDQIERNSILEIFNDQVEFQVLVSQFENDEVFGQFQDYSRYFADLYYFLNQIIQSGEQYQSFSFYIQLCITKTNNVNKQEFEKLISLVNFILNQTNKNIFLELHYEQLNGPITIKNKNNKDFKFLLALRHYYQKMFRDEIYHEIAELVLGI